VQKEVVLAMLERVGLSDLTGFPPAALSGGQRALAGLED
jgi:ABC-type uncharacterized transport system YnjBCD ATPase subunit